MEQNLNEKKSKPTKPSSHAAIRVRRETRKRLLAEIAKINKKDFGRRIRAEEYLSLAISLVTLEHVQMLQENSLSNADRLEREFRSYVASHGPISKDLYLGKRMSGEISNVGEIIDKHIGAQKSL